MSAGARPWSGRRLHLIGVGGAGMSAYARAAHALGAQVSGSDAAPGPLLARLQDDGVVAASVGHGAANLPAGGDVEVFYSSAVAEDNPERRAARERGLAEHPRAALLAELSALRRTIAVGGTHGKTTTAAMLVAALRAGGLDPGWLVGAAVSSELYNGHWSEGEWLVVEADESDRSMLSLDVEIAVVTNVELDHHATFGSLQQLRDDFSRFVSLARTAVVVWDRPELRSLVAAAGPSAAARGRLVTYDVAAPQLGREGVSFRWRDHDVQLVVPGAHNALNAAAALEASRLAGVQEATAVQALAAFGGAARRFQRVGRHRSGAAVFDDYAHHPTEIAATVAAARSLEPRRVVAVFQPHLYSRTALLAADFGRALAGADVVAVLEVYPARERAREHPGVSGLLVAEAAADRAQGRPVYWLPTFADARGALDGLLQQGDLCLVMGAGDVDRLARELTGGGGQQREAA